MGPYQSYSATEKKRKGIGGIAVAGYKIICAPLTMQQDIQTPEIVTWFVFVSVARIQ